MLENLTYCLQHESKTTVELYPKKYSSLIKDKVDDYLSASQAAYRGGKSTRDVIWVRKFIAAKAKKHQGLMVHFIGIEMCLAFDTFNRNDLIQELETFLDEGECGMSRLLLSNN